MNNQRVTALNIAIDWSVLRRCITPTLWWLKNRSLLLFLSVWKWLLDFIFLKLNCICVFRLQVCECFALIEVDISGLERVFHTAFLSRVLILSLLRIVIIMVGLSIFGKHGVMVFELLNVFGQAVLYRWNVLTLLLRCLSIIILLGVLHILRIFKLLLLLQLLASCNLCKLLFLIVIHVILLMLLLIILALLVFVVLIMILLLLF